MFNIGITEMIIIAGIAVVFIGPEKLPGVLRSLGKGLTGLKRAFNDVKHTVTSKIEDVGEGDKKKFHSIANDFNEIKDTFSSNNVSRLLDKAADALEVKDDPKAKKKIQKKKKE